MLKTRYLKIKVKSIEQEGYFLSGHDQEDRIYPVNLWSPLLFHDHQESFYGTFLKESKLNDVDGVIVNPWQLVTLFSKEHFNPFIDWEWDDTAEICLVTAPVLYDSITEKEWLPDFSSWVNDQLSWKLPKRIFEEFQPDFWKQRLAGDSTLQWVKNWFNDALNSYMTENANMRETIGDRITALQKQNLLPEQLEAFFDEDNWLRWIGLKENPLPFSIGLKLEEPAEMYNTWDLTAFLRDRSDPDTTVDYGDSGNYLPAWHAYEGAVQQELQRITMLFPWLAGKKGLASELTEAEAWLFLTEASETLLTLGIDILLPSWWQAMKQASMKVKAQVSGNPGSQRASFVGLQQMLDYNWRFSMNGVNLSEEEFNELVKEKRRLVQVRGRWIKLDPAFIHRIQELMKTAEKEGVHVRDLIEQELMPAEQNETGEDDLFAYGKIQIELNRQWRQMIKQLREIHQLPLADVPGGFHGELRPYQQLGMSWLLFLRKYGFGGILADDMGLGKTVQLLSYLLKVKEERKKDGSTNEAALIICPTSVLGNWQKEITKFSPTLKVYLHYGSQRLRDEAWKEMLSDCDVVLTSYGLCHLDHEQFAAETWGTIVIDEAQNIKNAATKQSRAVRQLKGAHHIALTGTPMENRLAELWSIFDFTNRGYLGSLGQFQRKFVLPIEKGKDKQKIDQLQAIIRPFLLRRTKKDEEVSLNLPDKLEQKEFCPLTAEQASLYEQLLQDTFAEIEKLSGFERKGLILQMLSRLKQLCNHPALYLKEAKPKQIIARSAKVEKLKELLEAVLDQQESCLIFTQYLDMGRMIQQMLKNEFSLSVPFLNGSVSKTERDRMIQQFQEREFPVFLLSLKAGGTGLNLTAANHVIHYDRWWNPAVENQATDRAYRIGQKRFVHVHKLICTGTLEEKIDLMLEQKQSLNDEIIRSDNWITELSTDELRDLVFLG
ncbi:DEAD/DEAH box helicase [Bacillaceae bacterium Marseille-Q3522]|nr:DEAD/DEAH box helicase [Bacillaceae bacterium Marseille-Q3522]